MTTAAAYFCPSCMSASIQASGLAGGDARCDVCGWQGRREDLLVHAFSHENGSDDDVARAFFVEFRNVFSGGVAVPIGRFLQKWGFLAEPEPELLARYLVAMVRAAAVAILEECKRLEHERGLHGT